MRCGVRGAGEGEGNIVGEGKVNVEVREPARSEVYGQVKDEVTVRMVTRTGARVRVTAKVWARGGRVRTH